MRMSKADKKKIYNVLNSNIRFTFSRSLDRQTFGRLVLDSISNTSMCCVVAVMAATTTSEDDYEETTPRLMCGQGHTSHNHIKTSCRAC